MPDIIPRTLQGSPFLVQWYQWGVIVGFILALAVTAWIFVDAQRSGQDATLWKSLAAVASVIGIPALLARVHQGFALEMRDSLGLVALFSIAGAVIAIAAAIGYAVSRSRVAAICPVCGQPQDPTWTQCPYHSAPPPVVPIPAPVPIANAGAPGYVPSDPLGATMSPTSSARETMIAGREQQSVHSPDSANRARGTVILNREPDSKPLALLIIKSGPYANTTLSLNAGVSTIGRDGRVNEHPIDDSSVSERHLSIRYADGKFTATDLDSSNGTFINGQRIDKQTLQSNDIVRIGTTEMVFVQVGDAPGSQPAGEAAH
jgi:hypothetical protein